MRKFFRVLAFAVSLAFIGCGGGGNNGTPPPVTQQNVSITVSPSSGFVGITQTQQFTASVSGTANQTVSWMVNGVTGGNAITGTVSATGLFTAPHQIPSPQRVTVAAVSQADPTKSASAALFISRVPPAGAWERTGPAGGTITVLAEDQSHPGTIYAGNSLGGNGGLFKSTDAGTHWTPLVTNSGLDQNPVFDIAVPASGNGSVIDICDGNFARSLDGGATWTEITLPANARAMAVDPQNRSLLYMSAPGTGVLKSSDGGTTWAVLPSSPVITSGSATAVLHNPLQVDLGQSSILYYGTDHGLFVSQNSGATWSASIAGFAAGDTAIRDIAGDPASPSTVFALAGAPSSTVVQLYASINHGTSWTLLASGLDGERIVPDPTNVSTLYLYGLQTHAVYKSTDGGHTFVASDTGIASVTVAANTLVIIGPTGTMIPLQAANTFLATLGAIGVFRSSDAAQSWSSASTGMASWFGAVLAVDPQVPATVYLGALNGGGIFRSADSGLTWANLRHDSAHAIAVDPFDSNHILAAAFDEGVIETHNGGSTWQSVTNLPPPPQGSATITGIAFHPTQAGTIYLSAQGGGVGVIRSTNGGASYAIANTGLTTDHATSGVAVNPQTPTMLFLGTDQGVFQSADGGNSWTLKTSRLTSTISLDARVTPPVIYISGAKSTDLGATWTAIPNTGPIIVDPSTPNSIFTVSFNVSGPQSAAWSPDGGTTLFPLNAALGQPGLFLGFGGNGMAIAPSNPQALFVASSTNGILRFAVGP